MPKVTIITYHYIRDLRRSHYPRIKAFEIDLFKKQLKYILKYYEVIKMQDLLGALKGQKTVSNNSLLLTFDDGYKDHFDFTLPILSEMGIQGSFFPVAKVVEENRVLDVNKIHFILASVKNLKSLVRDIYSLLDKYRTEYALETNEHYYDKLAIKDHLDIADVVFIKHLLQYYLPEKLRNIIVDNLFLKYVSQDEAVFARELYMNGDQLKELLKQGMYVGSHSWGHYWLNTLSPSEQEEDLKLSLKFLENLGGNTSEWVMCYPYGAYNDSLLSLLKFYGCSAALTAEARIANLGTDNFLALPRLDANDLPKDENSKPNEWTVKVIN